MRKPWRSCSTTAGKLPAVPAAIRCALQHATSASSTPSGAAKRRGTAASSACTRAWPTCSPSNAMRCAWPAGVFLPAASPWPPLSTATKLPGAPRARAWPRQHRCAGRHPNGGSCPATRRTAHRSRGACRDPAHDAGAMLPAATAHATCRVTAQQRCCRRGGHPRTGAPARRPRAGRAHSGQWEYPRRSPPPHAVHAPRLAPLRNTQMPTRLRRPTPPASRCARHRFPPTASCTSSLRPPSWW